MCYLQPRELPAGGLKEALPALPGALLRREGGKLLTEMDSTGNPL